MTAQITLQLDPTTDTTGNAEQVARMIGVSAWHISGDYLVVENPLLDYRVTNNETYSHKTDRIPNGAVVILVQEEPKTVEQQIEQEIQSKNLNAPRLTPDHIDSKIKAVEYILPRDVCKRDNGVEVFDAPLPLQTLTFCILTLENGFTVTGESACASPENFDAEIGKKIAYDNAREKIWLLEGYLLKEKLNHQIKIQEHFASQGVDAEKLQDSPIVSELPELEIKYSDAVKSTDPTNDNQACASGSASSSSSSSSSSNSNGYQLNAKRDNAFLVAQLLSNNKISAELRKKAETKMTALLDELI
nr:Gp49 family protein [Acinetobacter radioresistens]